LISARTEGLLSRLQTRGIKLGLDKVRALLDRLGHLPPQAHVVQIAGTNGKGSVAHGLEAIALAHGLTTGVFTSPHLISPTERIRVDGTPISASRFDRVADRLHRRIDSWSLEEPALRDITYFEFLFAMAVEVFRGAEVDLAVLEVGMGGRLDATTAERADVTCITSLSMDHETFLGGDLLSIAREKAGIVRPGIPLLIGPLPAEADSVVSARAREVGAPLERVSPRAGVRNGMWGEHQRINASLALALAGASGLPDGRASRSALAGVQVPGRTERIARAPEILLDGCHNPAGVAALAAALVEHPVEGRTDLLLSMGRDKDARGILAPLLPLVSTVHVTEYRGGRVPVPAEELAGVVEAMGAQVRVFPDAPSALRGAMERLGAADRLLVAGSLFLVGEVRQLLSPGGSP